MQKWGTCSRQLSQQKWKDSTSRSCCRMQSDKSVTKEAANAPQVRNLTYMVTRREKMKRSLWKVQEQIFQHQVRLLDHELLSGESMRWTNCNRFACGSFHMNFAFMLVNLASRRCVPSAFSGLQVRKLHVTNCNRLQFVTCWDILYWIIKVCFCTHDFRCGVWSFLYICTQQLFAELIERPSVGDVLQATSGRSFWISLMASLIARGNFGERRAEIRMWLAHRSCSSSYSQVWFVLSNKSAQC